MLISEQPYRAAKKGQALDDFIIKCKNSVNSNGNKPLSLITAGSYRTRTAAYQSLVAYWSDKTGPVLSDGKELGDEWRNKSYKDMSVSEKIAYNVDNYIEDYKALDKIESKNKEVAEIAQEKEKQDKEAVNEIKTYAVGKLTERIIFSPEDNGKDGSEKEGSNSSGVSVLGKTPMTAAKKIPNDVGTIMGHFHKETSAMADEEKKNEVNNEAREKRKIEALNLDNSRFELEKRRMMLDEEHRSSMLQMQNKQLDHQIQMDKEKNRLEEERNRQALLLEEERSKTAIRLEEERNKTTMMMMEMMKHIITKEK